MIVLGQPRLYFVIAWIRDRTTRQPPSDYTSLLVWAFSSKEAEARVISEKDGEGTIVSVAPYLGRLPDEHKASQASVARVQEQELGLSFDTEAS